MPSLKDYFGIINTPFQWVDLPESETLVSQKYQKTRVTEVPENQKHHSKNPQIKFEGVKVGFSKIWLHQLTRLSLVHLYPGLEFQNLKFEKIGFPHKTLSCSCSCSTRHSCSFITNYNYSCNTSYSASTNCSTSWNKSLCEVLGLLCYCPSAPYPSKILSEVFIYMCLQCIIIPKVLAREGIFCRISKRISNPAHSEE